MTTRKRNNLPRGIRPPCFVSRETGAAELEISPETWDRWVASGRLPPPAPGFTADTPRWRWEDIDFKMSGRGTGTAAIEQYLTGLAKINGSKKESERASA